MKLKELNKIIETINGLPISDMKEQAMTYKSALISVCEMHKPSQPGNGEALKAFDLGIRIQKVINDFELTKEELDFLKSIVDKSSIFFSVVIGRLSHYLSEVENPKVD